MTRSRSLAAALGLALGLLSAACQPPEDAATRYRRFAAAVRDGDTLTAWSLLSAGSQRQLEARSQALKASGPVGGVDLGPRQLLLGDQSLTSPKVKSARVDGGAGYRATVEVELEGGAHGRVEMAQEKDGWKVVLPGG